MPERTCIGCKGVFEKGGLLRLVVTDGVLRPDPRGTRGTRETRGTRGTRETRGTTQGRGAYICPDRRCLQEAYKNRGAFSRAFRTRVTLPDIHNLWLEMT